LTTPIFERGQAFTYEDSRRFADEMEARARDDWTQLDRSEAARSHKIKGTGKISVDVNAPKGTKVGAEGTGIFKDVEINRQTQMEPARKGPETLIYLNSPSATNSRHNQPAGKRTGFAFQ
jgi:hypothetical protein